MPTVMLRRDWGSPFRRTIKDKTGTPIAQLEMAPGEPLEVDFDQLSALGPDIEKGTIRVISVLETVAGAVIAETSPSVAGNSRRHRRR